MVYDKLCSKHAKEEFVRFTEEMKTILEKEPVITNNSVSSPRSDYAMESEDMKGGIAINSEDYLRPGEDQFLNDVIDFYLKYLTLKVLSESDQHRTRMSNSYFYKRLTSPHAQAVESTVRLSAAAEMHARVQNWLKNVNIFQKDFIIIPINEHADCFLTIICFPGLVGKVSTHRTQPEENNVRKIVGKSKELKEVKLQAVTIGSTTITSVNAERRYC